MRARVIAYVVGLVQTYRAALRSPVSRVAQTFYRERLHALTLELATLQGDDGEAHARRWAKVVPL